MATKRGKSLVRLVGELNALREAGGLGPVKTLPANKSEALLLLNQAERGQFGADAPPLQLATLEEIDALKLRVASTPGFQSLFNDVKSVAVWAAVEYTLRQQGKTAYPHTIKS